MLMKMQNLICLQLVYDSGKKRKLVLMREDGNYRMQGRDENINKLCDEIRNYYDSLNK